MWFDLLGSWLRTEHSCLQQSSEQSCGAAEFMFGIRSWENVNGSCGGPQEDVLFVETASQRAFLGD